MDQRASDVRRDIEHTRAALANKIETLDEQVRGKVENVKNTVDLSYQVEQHPWPMLGVSVAVGFLLERMVSGDSTSRRAERRQPTFIPIPIYSDGRTEHSQHAAGTVSATPASVAPNDTIRETGSKSKTDHQRNLEGKTATKQQKQDNNTGMLGDVLEQFKGEIHTIKGMAVGAVTSLVHDMIKQTSPAASSFMKQALNSASTKLTGKGILKEQPETQTSPPQLNPTQESQQAKQQDPQTTEVAASAYTGTRPPSLSEGRS